MPATFESHGLKFLYPDNWTPLQREQDEGGEGVTLELPSGGFFSVERIHDPRPDDLVIEELVASIQQGYQDAEQERLAPARTDSAHTTRPTHSAGSTENASIAPVGDWETAAEIRFYYLDLLIVSRLILITSGESRYLVQAQAESRDFEQNLPVFSALMKQIRDSLEA